MKPINERKEIYRDRNIIGFWHLYKIFKLDIFKHFFLTTACTLLTIFILSTSDFLIQNSSNKNYEGCCGNSNSHLPHKVISEEEEITKILNDSTNNYLPLFGKAADIVKAFNKKSLTKNEFALLLSLMIVIYSLLKYYDSYLENNIALKSSIYLKNKTLEKFRNLEFELKNEKKDEIKTVSETDSEIVADSWCHLYNHAYHNLLSIIFSIYFRSKELMKMNKLSLLLSFFWILLFNFIYIFILNIITLKEDKNKEHLTKETSSIYKEISNSILIESMGLSSHYQKSQTKIANEGIKIRNVINKLGSLNSSIYLLLLEIYIYIILLASSKPFSSSLKNYSVIMLISHSLGEVLTCFREYPSYSSSLLKINNFLSLPEKNENLNKDSICQEEIKKVIFSNVDFKYIKNEKKLLNKYNKVFDYSEINNLSGRNGTGKSTIIYLLLGMLKPLNGKILIELENGKFLDLNEDINLKEWKEKIISYCSHNNLIEYGSTGQKQIENIKNILKSKRTAKIFVFDEASNALDENRQKFLYKIINKLLKNKKIIIFVKH
jgi:ABC-type bacteriocin/lantibiotic exporter with double-glycine peptidase domain